MTTKEKLLKTAYKVFSEHGYRETTIRMIADAAKVNVASVNYHFGDKENLYLSVVRHWAEEAFEYYPIDELSDPSVSPEKKVELFIYNTLLCLFGKNGTGTGFGQLMLLEASISPSDLVHEVVTETIKQPTALLYEAIKSLTKENDDEKLKIHTACIVGQTVYFFLSRYLIKDLFDLYSLETEEDIRKLAGHISQIALASMR